MKVKNRICQRKGEKTTQEKKRTLCRFDFICEKNSISFSDAVFVSNYYTISFRDEKKTISFPIKCFPFRMQKR